VFGKAFTDHMLRIKWSTADGWEAPQITPLQPMLMHPAAKVIIT
jgi:branched-chain amino acid aminotransferase